MNITNLLIVNASIVLMYFDVFNLNHRLKVLFGYDPYKPIKPFDCYFCISFWIGLTIATVKLILDKDYIDFILLMMGVFLTAKTIDKLWS